jgi:1-acyl-sn-glycerol-3-phosphate acyltransferase
MRHDLPQAKTRLKFISPQFNPLIYYLTQWLLPILLRFRLRPWLPCGIAKIETTGAELLASLYEKFQKGDIRFLMAFRHPEVDDPLCMMHLFSKAVPKAAKKKGITLHLPTHSHFLYDRGMTIWAGDWLGWFFSSLGGLPIHRGKRLDKVGLKTARDLFANGMLPITVAPEGATNGHSERISPLEPGVAQLSFWCVEDLEKANRLEEVFIVPIGIQYSYINPNWEKIHWLLSKLEADCGLYSAVSSEGLEKLDALDPSADLYERLFNLGEHVVSLMEKFYSRFYHQPFNHKPIDEEFSDNNQALGVRIKALLDSSLKAAEQFFGLESQGTIIERCRRLEAASWDDIYRSDLPDVEDLTPIERGLADWIAEEAGLRVLHMRLAESFVAVTGSYVKEKPSFERFAETSLILFDLIARIKGEKSPKRPRLGWRQANLTVGNPISVTNRWENYQISRQAAREEINKLTDELQTSLEKMIGNKDYRVFTHLTD